MRVYGPLSDTKGTTSLMRLAQQFLTTPGSAQFDALPAREQRGWLTAELLTAVNAHDRQLLVALLTKPPGRAVDVRDAHRDDAS